jgi:hypothetical protein
MFVEYTDMKSGFLFFTPTERYAVQGDLFVGVGAGLVEIVAKTARVGCIGCVNRWLALVARTMNRHKS